MHVFITLLFIFSNKTVTHSLSHLRTATETTTGSERNRIASILTPCDSYSSGEPDGGKLRSRESAWWEPPWELSGLHSHRKSPAMEGGKAFSSHHACLRLLLLLLPLFSTTLSGWFRLSLTLYISLFLIFGLSFPHPLRLKRGTEACATRLYRLAKPAVRPACLPEMVSQQSRASKRVGMLCHFLFLFL